jgi:hypothetical protein
MAHKKMIARANEKIALSLTYQRCGATFALQTLATARGAPTKDQQIRKSFFMEREPNLITSSASRNIIEEDVSFKVGIYKLEGGDGWSLEVVTADGTSIVCDDQFQDDQAAFEETVATIRKEGAIAFANGGSNVIPFKN